MATTTAPPTSTSYPESMITRPALTFGQILSMNVGFFGIQFSFGLQQSNMSPIYRYLGADEAKLPLLWLAGPMTGLIVQPLIGAMSDRTLSSRGPAHPLLPDRRGAVQPRSPRDALQPRALGSSTPATT